MTWGPLACSAPVNSALVANDVSTLAAWSTHSTFMAPVLLRTLTGERTFSTGKNNTPFVFAETRVLDLSETGAGDAGAPCSAQMTRSALPGVPVAVLAI